MTEKITEWLKALPKKILDWWEHFTSRQKTTIISLALGVIIAFVILIVSVLKPQYVSIYTTTNPADTQTALDILASGDNLDYHTSEDGLEIFVNRKDYTEANLLLASNKVYTTAFTIDNVTEGGFTSTEADRQRRYVVYLEDLMESTLETYTFVKSATVQLNIPEDDGTMISRNQETSASVMLTLSDVCSREAAAAMARFVATGLGNDSTDHVVIVDNQGNLLFSGSDETSTFGVASNLLALQAQYAEDMAENVRRIFLASNAFSTVEVAANVVLDSSVTEESLHEYSVADGRDEGYLASEDNFASENSGGISGVPGTTSQVETGYEYRENEYSSGTATEEHREYLPNERTVYRQIPAGDINRDASSITAMCLTYNIVREEDIRNQGLLDGITWEEYKLNNSERTRVEVDEDLFTAVSNATGVAEKNISIVVYEEPFFIDREGIDVEVADVLQILLILLILGLLAFVVLRSMRAPKVDEEETEISIEDILKSTPETALEEISVEDKSDSRIIVEKFVEDNPEAAANLLRNWLTEDWG